MFERRLINLFDRYDENDTFHNGFLQSINLNAYVDLTFLNDITLNLMDSYIKNEISKMIINSNWASFLSWDKDRKDFIINSDFYDSAKYALYSYLLKSQKFYDFMNINFKSITAQESEMLSFGAKEEEKNYDKVIVEVERENDTTQYGQTQRTLQYGATQQTNSYGATSKTNTIGQQTNTSGTVHSKHPFDLGNDVYLGDTKDDTNTQNGQRQDTEQETQHSDTISEIQHSDTDTNNQHTDTNTYGDITNTTNERKDTSLIKAHVDTKTKTKVVILSPEKYYEIEKELVCYNVYELLLNSVKDCFTIKCF